MSGVGIQLEAKRPDKLWGPPCLLFIGYRGSFFGIKWFRYNGWLHASISIEDKNEWSYTSTPPIFLHGSYRGNLNHYFWSL
jgi:hypothetical protein